MADEMLRMPDVMSRVGLSRTSIWRRVRAGTFPAPIELGANSIGWPENAISEWITSRPFRAYGATTADSHTDATARDMGDA